MRPRDQIDGEEQLRDAGSEPHRVVAVGGARVAGNIAGDDLGGRRSSGEVKPVARGHDEVRGVVLRHPRSAVGLTGRVARPLGGRSYVGDELRRRCVR